MGKKNRLDFDLPGPRCWAGETQMKMMADRTSSCRRLLGVRMKHSSDLLFQRPGYRVRPAGFQIEARKSDSVR